MDGDAKATVSPQKNPVPAPGPVTAASAPAGGVYSELQSLQRAAGNRAATGLLLQRQRHDRGHGAGRRQPVEVQFTVTQTPRVVHPHSLQHASVLMSLRSQEAGSTDLNAEYDVEVDPDGHVTHVTIRAPVTVTLPEWPDSSRLPAAARAEWERFSHALDEHEQGHVRIARQFFEHFGRQMLHVTEAEAATRWEANMASWRQAEQDFDARTDHGRNEGTIIDETVAGATTNINATPPTTGPPPAHP